MAIFRLSQRGGGEGVIFLKLYLFVGGRCRVAEDGETGWVNGLLLLISRLFLLLFASFPLSRRLSSPGIFAAFCFLERKKILSTNVADPGSDAFLTPLDPGSGMGKKSRSGSGMNIPGHIFEILEAIFWVITKSTSIL